MKIISLIFKELFGLFVDDGSLAIGILALVAALAVLMQTGLPPIFAGPLLFIGCVALLVENVARTVRAKRR